ncbi:hypothetical protein LTS10_010851 [Elasticomyces elasticus]|nr:hypothetical protein LTS10_010851 [Elasticomyces elasticus]
MIFGQSDLKDSFFQVDPSTSWNSILDSAPPPAGVLDPPTVHHSRNIKVPSDRRKLQNRNAQKTSRARNASNAKRVKDLEAEVEKLRAIHTLDKEQITSLELATSHLRDDVKKGKHIIRALGSVYCARKPQGMSSLASLLADGLEESTSGVVVHELVRDHSDSFSRAEVKDYM